MTSTPSLVRRAAAELLGSAILLAVVVSGRTATIQAWVERPCKSLRPFVASRPGCAEGAAPAVAQPPLHSL